MTLIKRITDSFSAYPVFTINDAELAIPDANKSDIRQILFYMASTGRLYRVRSGRYSFRKDSLVSGFAFRPFYYGLLSALTYRELWDQLAKPCIITTNTVKSTRVKIFGDMTAETHHIPKKYMFGFSVVQYGGMQIPVSDAEKTLIDMAYLRYKASAECYAQLCGASSADTLFGYLKAYDSHTKAAVRNIFARYASREIGRY